MRLLQTYLSSASSLLFLLIAACGGSSDGDVACATDVDCAGGQLCTRGLCREACSAADPCSDARLLCHPADGVCVACVLDGDCDDSQRCEENVCVDGCSDDSACGGGQRCEVATRTCVSLGCGGDMDCAGGEGCRVATGECAPICVFDGTCAVGEVCAAGLCLAAEASCSEGDPTACGGLADCVDRVCICPPARDCGGLCVDRQSDGRHCGVCGNECDLSQVCTGGCCVPGENRVDLLFVVDGSGSMEQEQVSLADQLPRLLRVLTSGDTDLDGIQDFEPVTDLHAGVVTVDMGTGGFAVDGCSEPARGDDGVLRATGNAGISGCDESYPSFLDFTLIGDDALFARSLSCVARVGTDGCGFEQQLESSLKALTPAASTLLFSGGTTGHGTGLNDGFLREDSLLAIVLLTDEDDCSSSDPELFNPGSTRYPGAVNLRCFQHAGALHPISRYVNGFLELRRDPRRLVFATIVGVPPDLVPESTDVDYEAILNDPRMQERPDPATPDRLTASCSVPGRGVAFPPRRIVSVARDLERAGAGATVVSICSEDYSSAFDAILPRLTSSSAGPECP